MTDSSAAPGRQTMRREKCVPSLARLAGVSDGRDVTRVRCGPGRLFPPELMPIRSPRRPTRITRYIYNNSDFFCVKPNLSRFCISLKRSAGTVIPDEALQPL